MISLRCPTCKSELSKRNNVLKCISCNSSYRTNDGILNMLPSDLDKIIKKNIDSWENIKYSYSDHINQLPPERLQSIDKPLIEQCKEGKSVLEVGCGNGRLKKEVEKKGCNYTGIDPSLNLLKEIKDQNVVVQGVGEYLPFPDNHFDIIIGGYHSFRYIELEQGFYECARVLKPGGILAFTLWNHWALNINSLLLNLRHLTRLSLNSPLKNKDEICNDVSWAKNEIKKLEGFGFDVESILSTKKFITFDLPILNRIFNWNGYWHGVLGTLIGYDIIFVCKKR